MHEQCYEDLLEISITFVKALRRDIKKLGGDFFVVLRMGLGFQSKAVLTNFFHMFFLTTV